MEAVEIRTRARLETVVKELAPPKERGKIPTTFVPLSPDEIPFDAEGADVLDGVFHVMWSDMPEPRTYAMKLSDRVAPDGRRLGCRLECHYPRQSLVLLDDQTE